MTKELTVKPAQEIIAVGNRIDEIVNECLPVAAQENQNFVQALTLANGIKALREIFLHNPHIKETVESMQNTHLGFMTDRTDLAVWKSKQPGSNKELKPYRYEDVAEVCIEAMLNGYRITNNEFNIIAGRFYAAKNGKFRRIQECEGVTDFQFTTTSPAYEPIQGGVQYAKVQGFASWRKDGQLATLGSSAVAEDKLIFKIRVNKQMGEDAIVGKALSKLFSRVLMRLEGKIMPEATDISEGDVVEGEIETESASDLTDKIKEKAEEMDQKEDVKEDEAGKAGQVVDAEFVGQDPADKQEPPPDTKKDNEDLKAATKKQDDLMTHGIDPALAKTFGELTNSSDAGVFWRMREKGLDLFFDMFEGVMNTWPKEIQDFVMAKCKNIAGKHPEFLERFNAAMKEAEISHGYILCPDGGPHAGTRVSFATVCGDCDLKDKCREYQVCFQLLFQQDKDNSEDWNGLKSCPKMNNMNIPKIRCKDCEDRSTCSVWGGGMEQF